MKLKSEVFIFESSHKKANLRAFLDLFLEDLNRNSKPSKILRAKNKY